MLGLPVLLHRVRTSSRRREDPDRAIFCPIGVAVPGLWAQVAPAWGGRDAPGSAGKTWSAARPGKPWEEETFWG